MALCSSEKEIDCVDKVHLNFSECLTLCSGLLITSSTKYRTVENFESLISEEVHAYNKYIQWSDLPSGLKGYILFTFALLFIFTFLTAKVIILDYEWKNKLRYVRIFFDTPIFDRITKDRAAKFVDILSAIGGTMGLLTGFSIISGVEILYFAAKMCMKVLKKEDNSKSGKKIIFE